MLSAKNQFILIKHYYYFIILVTNKLMAIVFTSILTYNLYSVILNNIIMHILTIKCRL